MRASPHACLQRARTLRTLTALTALTPDSSGELLAATKTKLDNLQQTVTKLGSEHDEAERAECAARNALREASLKVFNTSFDLAHAQQSVEQLNDYKHKLEEAARPVDPKEYARLENDIKRRRAALEANEQLAKRMKLRLETQQQLDVQGTEKRAEAALAAAAEPRFGHGAGQGRGVTHHREARGLLSPARAR